MTKSVFKNAFIQLLPLLGAILLFAIVIFSAAAYGDVGTETEYLIAPQGVKVGEAWYPFGPERIDQARKVWIDTLSKSVECHATTRFAVRKDDAIVLVELGRRKQSKSAGIFCFVSHGINKFSKPIEFNHGVLRLGPNPTVDAVMSAYDPTRPEIKPNELKTTNILGAKKHISGYLRIALARETGLVKRASFNVRVREISAEEMNQLPPFKPLDQSLHSDL